MPASLKWPGVYIEEVKSPVRTITGVSTSITAFIGRARKGPVNEPTTVFNFAEYVREFGDLWRESSMGYAVKHYFDNGGSEALIVRIHKGASDASVTIPGAFDLQASSLGLWANGYTVEIDHATNPALTDNTLFNLTVKDKDGALLETHLNLSAKPGEPRYVDTFLKQRSRVVRVKGPVTAVRPGAAVYTLAAAAGADGAQLATADYVSTANPKESLWALEKADLFNLLCVPPPDSSSKFLKAELDTFASFCKDHRAMLIVDAPYDWTTPALAKAGLSALMATTSNAAVYFPRLRMSDPLQENRLEEFPPCGVVAGIMARTDSNRGVWKAPAGIDTQLLGVDGFTVPLTNEENGLLNPIGLNCFRSFPDIGNVVWGARTREGADILASEWKYVPVRRLALFLEESLYRGTQWVVFEPNDEPLWSQIRLNVGAFMHSMFRQGAFQGMTPKEAYKVECSSITTTEDDRNRGIVNIVVGFAPLKPAEFVVIKIQQLAGQIQT